MSETRKQWEDEADGHKPSHFDAGQVKNQSEQFPLTSADEFGECIDFIKAEIVEAEKSVKFRDDSYKTWRGGTDNSWRQAGCYETKAARIKTSDGHGRMAIKCRKKLKLLQSTLAILTAAKEFKL